MFLHDLIKLVFQICSIFGLISFRFNKNTQEWESSPLLKGLVIISMIINGCLFVFFIVFNESIIIGTESKIKDHLYVFLVILNQFQAIVMIVELFVKREISIKLLYLFEILDSSFKECFKMHLDYKRIKKSLLYFVTLCFAGAILLAAADLLHFIQGEDMRILYLMLIFVFPNILNKFSYVISFILLTLVEQSIDVLHKYIKSVTKQNSYYISEISLNNLKSNGKNWKEVQLDEIDMKQLLVIKQLYSLIWEASNEINYLMQWTLSVGFANEFYVLIFSSFFLILGVMSIEEHTIGFHMLVSIWILIIMTHFVAMASICIKISESVSSMTILLNLVKN